MYRDATEHAFVEAVSSEAAPYLYVGSGLSNVYLVGVTFRRWENGDQSADIPCLQQLLTAIARALVAKAGPLKGEEVRFLRKRMGYASKAFAEFLGFAPETISRIENDAVEWQKQTDMLIRFVYAALEKLPAKVSQNVVSAKWTADFDKKQNIIATLDRKHNWQVQIDCVAA